MTDWNGKRVLIIGAARQGIALSRYLSAEGADITLNDRQNSNALTETQASLADYRIHWVLGEHPLTLLDTADLVCISGGVPSNLPLILEARKRGIPISNDTQIFLEACPCRVIGITGSAGKTTTTALVGRIAQSASDKGGAGSPAHVWVGGNIGYPLISYVKEMRPQDLVVMEVSSFQLELTRTSPQIAAILNITPNHLDRHGTMAAYTAAKANLLAYQSSEDIAILGAEDAGAWSLRDQVNGKLIAFGIDKNDQSVACTYLKEDNLTLFDGQKETIIMPRSAVSLRGKHNILNVLAACAISHAAGLPVEAMLHGVEGFGGVPHRLELVRRWQGIAWYNDSIATAPERTIAAIRSFKEPLVLMLGGRDKDLPWESLAKLIHERVDHVVIFGEAAPIISRAIGLAQSDSRPFSVDMCLNLHEAVEAAVKQASAGDVVLLSPGGTSFDEFKDFEERGEYFRQWVQQLQ